MRYRSHIRSHKHILVLSALFATTLLLVSCGLIALSATAVTAEQPTAGGPVRLRLKVDYTTFRSDQATKMWAEFLDGDYNKVANDGTRDVKFEVEPRGSGSISPPTAVTIKPGAWFTPYVTFKPGGPGKVLIRVSSVGLASDQTFLWVTKPAASFLTQVIELFEPVAYADNPLQVLPTSDNGTFSTSAGSQAKFQVAFGSAKAGTKIRIFTKPPAKLINTEEYKPDGKNREYEGEMYLTLGTDGGFSKPLSVTAATEGEVQVLAQVLHNDRPASATDPVASATAKFTPRRPSFIRFVDNLNDLPADQTDFWVTVQLADDNDHVIKADRTTTISFKSAKKDDAVTFQPNPLKIDPGQGSATVNVTLNQTLSGRELMILASPDDQSLPPRQHPSIFIRNPVEMVTLSPQQQPAIRGNMSVDLTIGFADKNGKASIADKDRQVSLSLTGGSLSQNPVTIPKNQESATVQFTPYFTNGTVTLKARSFGLTEATAGIVLITPFYWLALSAIGGGFLGGVARHLCKSDDPDRKLPTLKLTWKSVINSLLGSLISGFVFYLAMKLGLSQALGFVLPASFDVGTLLAAFLLASIGGYMGVERVFDSIASLWSRRQQTSQNSNGQLSPDLNKAPQS